MKKTILILLTVVLLFPLYAQTGALGSNTGYYVNENFVSWKVDSTSIILLSDDSYIDSCVLSLSEIFNQENESIVFSDEDNSIVINSRRLLELNVDSLFRTLPNSIFSKITFWDYAKIINGEHIWLRNEVVAKMKNTNSWSRIQNTLSNFVYDTCYKEDDLYVHVLCTNPTELVRIANTLYESGLVEFSEPDFYAEYSQHYNDPLFSQQYYLNNTGQSIISENGHSSDITSNIDIQAPEAWNFISFVSAIDTPKVGIVDDGVEDHEDLKFGNISKVLNGFPMSNHGRPQTLMAHGECVAGIVAATQNNGKGISGVAPNSWIIPIRNQKISYRNGYNYPLILYMNNSRIARGIREAWKDYDVDILNFSWGSLHEISNQITDAIQTALREGRDGKGCVVVASSGNERKTDNINHIAKIPGVIGVGGLMGNGRRGEYSNCSSELSLMAFGGQVVEQDERGNYCDIRTIDREGNNGYNTGNYCTYFGMTSAAAPMVSGVASLMLSVNPELTSTQVKNIMENTAKEWEDYNFSTTSAHPNGSWNAEVGYGLVDAHKAVVHAYEYGYDMKIVGSDELADCDNREYTCDILRPELFTYEWNCSNNLVKVSEDGATAHFMPLAVGVGMVTVNVKQQDEIMFSLNKEVTISSISVNISPVATADFSVTSDATWSASTYLPVEVTVENGSTLTITGTLHCAPTARIIVRPGARLVVDGGTLTGACDNDLWEGIFVEGNPSQHQSANYQGVVELRNGATIENARCAIRTALPGDTIATTGGIILATDAIFRNNARAVEFLPYADHVSATAVRANYSHFSNCTFTVDNDNHFSAAGADFNAHVRLAGVKDVRFTGCSFGNTATNGTNRGRAIFSQNAGFVVGTQCGAPSNMSTSCECPETYATRSTFSGFATAIEAGTSGNQYAVTVNEAQFATNGTAIAINGSSHATITRCDFDLTYIPVQSMRMNAGLYLNACTGYKVEQNDFHKNYNPLLGNNTVGVRVNASGTDDNVIYRNTFTNMGYAVYAQGVNGGSRPITGLEVKCNEFSGNSYDVYVAAGATIRPTQGSSLVSAGNTFNNTGISCLYAMDANNYQYLYSSGAGQAPVSHHNFATYLSARANTCASTLCNDGPITPNPIASGVATLNEVGSAYATSHEAVRQLMSDTVVSLPAIKGWYAATPGLASRYAEAETECQMANANDVILQDIEAGNHLTAEQRAEYDNYVAFNTLKYQTGDWMNATPQQIEQLQIIADNRTGRSSVMAQSVLCFYFDLCQEEDIPEAREDAKSARLNLQSEWVYWRKPQNPNYTAEYLNWVYPMSRRVIKDTIINDLLGIPADYIDNWFYVGGSQHCYVTDFKLPTNTGDYKPVIILSDSDRVYYFDPYYKIEGGFSPLEQGPTVRNFHLLYDFTLQPGDMYVIPVLMGGPFPFEVVVMVDSVGWETTYGDSLRVLYVHDATIDLYNTGITLSLGKDNMIPYKIIERIGSEYYFVPQMLNYIYGQEDISVGLCSYSDEEMYYQANEDKSCEFPRPVSIEEHSPSDYTIGPNPTNDKVTVSIQEGMVESIQLYDVVGRLMLSMKPQHTNDIEVDLSHFPEGVYILKVTMDNNCVISQKVTKIR